ncbi:MAG TPA: DUF5681 domain-containing protein [Gemmataceae bacterium]|nr:DUF5681 domain-containing protein [Gemmataceae bacterium]
MADDDKTYEVGYGKPPKTGQFKKGKSGNLKGRPKGSPNLKKAILRAMQEHVVVIQNGRRRSISKIDAAAKQLANRAAAGDHRALQILVSLAAIFEGESPAEGTTPLSGADQKVLEGVINRIRRSSPRTDGTTE